MLKNKKRKVLNAAIELGLIPDEGKQGIVPEYYVSTLDKIPLDVVEKIQKLRSEGNSYSKISLSLRDEVVLGVPAIRAILAKYGQAPVTQTITAVLENNTALGEYIHQKTGFEPAELVILSEHQAFVETHLSTTKLLQNTQRSLKILDLARTALEDGLNDPDPKIRIASAQVLAKGWAVYTSDCDMNLVKEKVQDIQYKLDKQKLLSGKPEKQEFTVQVLRLDSKEFERVNKYHQQLEKRKQDAIPTTAEAEASNIS